eukprot:CAMPEP_0183715556 /NCGR_PEP_ID=MMETSP0737-20130205/9716_1 /TAXON_ID=385413 /ORGANISM="Thalassiosira miniscula, Strain CCMP1093" /LENGTH=587 /DNA_ID=CAMNT_0025944657 /DNA_START=10 /DNA_END=1774 /DNA_ORIENTATION=+
MSTAQQQPRQARATATLSSVDIRDAGAANSVFGGDTSVMVARPGKICCAFPLFWFTIPEGFYALVTRHGAHQDYVDSKGKKSPVWPSGLHLGPPWLKVSHLVTKQAILFNTQIKGCKTKDNVTAFIDVSIILRVMGDDPEKTPGDDPENVFKFVHEVTPAGLQAQLQDAQAEAVRTLARSVYHTEVFGLRNVAHSELEGVQEKLFSAEAMERGGAATQEEKDMLGEHDYYDSLEAGFNVEAGASITEAMKVRLNRQFNKQGIQILDVAIKDITLPDQIQSQMSQKTMVISQNAMQRMQQKHAMQSLLQEEEIKTLNQTHDLNKIELEKDGEYDVMMAKFKLDALRAENDRNIQSIETQMSIDVELVKAESDLTCQRIEDETKMETEKIREQCIADSEESLANAKAEVEILLAEGELEVAKNIAKGEKAIFKAEGIAAPLNRRLNDHISNMHLLKAQSAMAENERLVIVGTEGGSAANSLLQADAALSSLPEHMDDQSRETLLTEMAIATGRGDVRIMMGVPFSTSAGRKGTQSLPDGGGNGEDDGAINQGPVPGFAAALMETAAEGAFALPPPDEGSESVEEEETKI